MADIQITTVVKRRFENQVERITESGCWIWMGCINDSGYGIAYCEKTLVRAHRLSYLIHIGPIPDGLELDHLCRVRCCVNPAHLEAVTRKENLRRGINAESNRTHCPQGHPYNEENTLISKWKGKTGRQCRICHAKYSAIATRKWKDKKAAHPMSLPSAT